MILVTGATGWTGARLVQRLSERGVPVRVMVRNRAKAAALSVLPKVEVVEGDLMLADTLREALRGVERAMLISSSVPTMVEAQSSFIAAAKKARVQHVVKLSGIVASLDSPFRFARMHAEIERVLEASGMAFTHLRCGEFMHSYFRAVSAIVSKGILPLPMEDAKIASIDVGDIAAAAALVLTSPGHEGKTYPLTGPEALSMSEVAERLSAVTGKTIRYVDVPPDEAKKAQLAAGVPEAAAGALYELFAERRKGKEATVYPTLQTVFGVPGTTLAAFAARHAAIFRGDEPPPKV